MRWWFVALPLLSCLGIASETERAPRSAEDAGLERDAGAELDDAGFVEPVDGGVTDGGARDAGGGDGGSLSMDAGSPRDAGFADAGLDAGISSLVECPGGSIDRLTSWSAPEGMLETATGVRWNLLFPENGRRVARVKFLGNDWHGILVMMTNEPDAAPRARQIVDARTSAGFTVTYRSTADLHLQLRAFDSWGGPNLYAATIPSSHGAVAIVQLPLVASQWHSLFQAPVFTFEQTLEQLRGVTIVGNEPNDVDLLGLRLDGYVPSCP